MNSEIPKQFMLLAGKPVLMHTIERFIAFDPSINIIVVLPAKETSEWQSLCEKHAFGVKHMVVTGGNTRFHSVKNGLDTITEKGMIGVHDGVLMKPVKKEMQFLLCMCANRCEKLTD